MEDILIKHKRRKFLLIRIFFRIFRQVQIFLRSSVYLRSISLREPLTFKMQKDYIKILSENAKCLIKFHAHNSDTFPHFQNLVGVVKIRN
eukprot:TRINITY_DN434_c0_g1_i2.p1 TRINITY_DN434_c0_g1~~TRINITY_DN434_c0_g1_i2.p1  ORF type:complete len:90 (+),score=4.41 TRINITY_DN434_c0_g1_i2:97-366(+)